MAMRRHKGMRPHDVVVLLKIASKKDSPWMMRDLAYELGISPGEISESLQRSVFAGFITPDKTRLMRQNLLEFLVHGLRYVFPQRPGPMVRGVPTAHAAPPLVDEMAQGEPYVWPHGEGNVRGESIEPLYAGLPDACLKDPVFHEYMALCDALRVGRVRERQLAEEELKSRLC
jgi:hypothetical protein